MNEKIESFVNDLEPTTIYDGARIYQFGFRDLCEVLKTFSQSDALNAREWIPVSELPEKEGEYLATLGSIKEYGKFKRAVIQFDGTNFYDDLFWDWKLLAWQEISPFLPDAAEKEV